MTTTNEATPAPAIGAPATTVGGLLLAAGAGRRFGMPKALARLDGVTLADHAARALRDGGCRPVVVVLGAAAEQVRFEASLAGAEVVVNEDWPTGMGSSLRAGLHHLARRDEVDAALVLPVDVPGVPAAAVCRVAAAATPAALAAATYGGERGHPVLLGRDHWPAVRAGATGDRGARQYLAAHPPTPIPCDDLGDGGDVDTPADLAAREARGDPA